MTPFYQDEKLEIWNGDCRDVLEYLNFLETHEVDSIVTDPPYELGFMGKKWDGTGIAYDVNVWRECLKILKPGGHLLAFGGSRTYHRLACAIEDAGFEVRDQIQWIYGSGFPKSLDVSRAIDAAAGASRSEGGREWNGGQRAAGIMGVNLGTQTRTIFDLPATDAAKQWNGWGTALKPAFECITVARKPYEYGVEYDVIITSLSLLGARLCSLLPVRIATEHFKLSEADLSAAFDSAQWSADERNNTRDALLGQMDTSQFVLAMNMSLNTVQSWQHIVDDLCELMSTSTIETKTSLITDLRILNYLLSQTTPDFIIKAASQTDGHSLLALSVARHFNAARLKLNGILMLSAQDDATSKAHTLRRAEVENNGIIMARKPLEKGLTVAANVLKYGTGGLNIDGCRIEGTGYQRGEVSSRNVDLPGADRSDAAAGMYAPNRGFVATDSPLGRWPANIIHDGSDEVLAGFPEVKTGGGIKPHINEGSTFQASNSITATFNGDEGSASRFFYCPKSSKQDREEGLQDLAIRSAGNVTDRKDGSDGLNSPRAGAGRTNGSRNQHPTVKPTELMRYLVRLITPPGGTVLDLFAGSGSTGKACALEQMKAILIEKELEYCELAVRRARLRQQLITF